MGGEETCNKIQRMKMVIKVGGEKLVMKVGKDADDAYCHDRMREMR